MQLIGVFELRDLEQSEFRSVGEEGFAIEMQELHHKIREQFKNSNQEYKRRKDQHRRELSSSASEKRKVPKGNI
jgi:hypothetical protein